LARLAINVDHVATLRQARLPPNRTPPPPPCLRTGRGTRHVVHLREDRRHIQDRDITVLRETIKTKMNLEMAATKEMVELHKDKTRYVTMVPEKRQELTTEGASMCFFSRKPWRRSRDHSWQRHRHKPLHRSRPKHIKGPPA